MAIGRLYYFTLSILALGFCCISHYHMWPEKGYTPHSNVGNKYRKDPKVEKEERKKERKERKERHRRDSGERRHKYDDDYDEPEWIADFNSKRKGENNHADDIPLSAAAQQAGRPRRVSFEDEQRPDLSVTSTEQALDRHHAEVDVMARASDLQTVTTSSLPVHHTNTATSQSLSYPNQSQMVTSLQGLGLSMACDKTDVPTFSKNSKDILEYHTTTLPSQESNLRKHRIEASPEKFNTGQFEPLQPQSLVSNKRFRANDGTPRVVAAPNSIPQQSQLTATLSNFNFTPNTTEQVTTVARRDEALATGFHTQHIPRQGPTARSQLTAGLEGLTFSTPKAYSVLLQDLSPTPNKKPAKKPFDLISAFCADNDLLLLLTSYLSIPSLISLYSISKEFHHQFNCHHTAQILSIMRTWAPNSDIVYPWRCYKKLCVKDPKLRQKSRLQGKEDRVLNKYDDLRDVPSLRWLQMVVYRHGVCKDILIQLAVHGHRYPPGTLNTLKRLWFILDLPTTAQRTLVIHSKDFISDGHLHLLTMFFLKLDMHFTDPAGRLWPANHPDPYRFPHELSNLGFVGCSLRKTLLAERSLTPLWRVLRGWSPDPRDPARPMETLDVIRLWVRHYYEPPEDDREDTEELQEGAKSLPVLGVPPHECGAAQLERLGKPYVVVDEEILKEMVRQQGTKIGDIMKKAVTPFKMVNPRDGMQVEKLVRVDQLVMRESVKRELGLGEYWVKMMVFGWHDTIGRRLPMLTEEEMLRMSKELPLLPRKGRSG